MTQYVLLEPHVMNTPSQGPVLVSKGTLVGDGTLYAVTVPSPSMTGVDTPSDAKVEDVIATMFAPQLPGVPVAMPVNQVPGFYPKRVVKSAVKLKQERSQR